MGPIYKNWKDANFLLQLDARLSSNYQLNDFDEKKPVRSDRMLVLTEIVTSETQCISSVTRSSKAVSLLSDFLRDTVTTIA